MIHFEDIAPRTKESKHEIVFTPGLYDNHEFNLRSGFEGRRLWELAKVLKSERGRALADKYPQFLFEYDCVQDPEGMFNSISTPHIGRISLDRKVRKIGFGEKDSPYEGDILIPPFFPIFYTPDFVAEYIEKRTIESGGVELLLSEDRSLIYMWPDSCNAIMLSNMASYYKGCQKLYDEFPEIKVYSDYDDSRSRLVDTETKLRSKRPQLNEIRENKDLMNGLINLARYHVLNSLAGASMFQRDFALCQRSSKNTFRNGPGQERTYASPKLTRRLANSAVALCKEYLLEMK